MVLEFGLPSGADFDLRKDLFKDFWPLLKIKKSMKEKQVQIALAKQMLSLIDKNLEYAKKNNLENLEKNHQRQKHRVESIVSNCCFFLLKKPVKLKF